MRKKLIIFGTIAAVLVFGYLAYFLTKSQPQEEPDSTPTPESTPTTFPEPDAASEAQAKSAKDQEHSGNPVLARLPEENQYWELTWDGSEGDKYRLKATVYFVGGENPQEKISQQRPYVEQFVRSTGQTDGTYLIEYETKQVDSSAEQS